MTYQPYKYWKAAGLRSHLNRLADVFNLDPYSKELVKEAGLSDQWNPVEQYDGCSVVQDMYHPCLSCFIHDYLWRTGQGGKEADEIFYYLMLKEGMDLKRARRRWFYVRVGWLFYYKWKHFKLRNVNPFSQNFKDSLSYLRKEFRKK